MGTGAIIAAFWAVILIGIPLWWKTTQVYRANLPFKEIEDWRTRQVREKESCSIKSHSGLDLPTSLVIHIPTSIRYYEPDELGARLQRQLTVEFRDSSSCADFSVSVQCVPWHEDQPELDKLLGQHQQAPTGQYHFYLTSSSTRDVSNVTIGHGRVSMLQLADLASLDRVQETLLIVLRSIFKKEYEALGQIACRTDHIRDKHDMDSMRAFQYSSGYQVTLSLMNKDPGRLVVDWDIREAIRSYLYPLLKELSVVSNFTVDSQIQHYASLSLQPHYKERSGRAGYYYFEPHELSHFIHSADWNLASTISSFPTVNLILYVPSPDERLWIHDSKVLGRPLSENAFLIPRWGGVVIKNPPSSHALKNNNKTSEQGPPFYRFDKEKLQPVMRTFVSQLRSLMGVHPLEIQHVPRDMNVTFLAAPRTGITLLEKDHLIRRRLVENVANAASTLHSLAQLVMEIPNMVVPDHIDLQVRRSLKALDLVRESLAEGAYDSALQLSIEAIELAEQAFFDPNMVSMLYFPDEHKYAIYMPLFVPISVPLIMAVIKTVKRKPSEKQKTE